MTTITFDVTLFRQMFPEFSNSTTFSDALLQMYWNEAICYISDQDGFGNLQGNCRDLALNLMTAHLTKISIYTANNQDSILVQNATIDKITVGLTPPPLKNQWQWWLSTTSYGARLLALLAQKSVGGFLVGGLPETSGFRKIGGVF